jgi:hypothetical protein
MRHVAQSPPEPPPMPTHAGRYVLGNGAWDRTDEDATPAEETPAAVNPIEPSPAIPQAIDPAPQSEE